MDAFLAQKTPLLGAPWQQQKSVGSGQGWWTSAPSQVYKDSAFSKHRTIPSSDTLNHAVAQHPKLHTRLKGYSEASYKVSETERQGHQATCTDPHELLLHFLMQQ